MSNEIWAIGNEICSASEAEIGFSAKWLFAPKFIIGVWKGKHSESFQKVIFNTLVHTKDNYAN